MAPTPDPRRIIARKRDGHELSAEDIKSLLESYVVGDVPDYQMSAFLMATLLKGMTSRETEAMARAMINSGSVLSWEGIPGPFVDKHSTGGVGDKVSMILAPLLASLGLKVPMISGRGLGHTGGTLDKLEAVPGYRVELETSEMRDLLRDVGMFIAGQTLSLVPADRKLYALRDVTATIESPPLIVGSILSKKTAAGVQFLVLDVKFGEGAFMSTLSRARALAERLVATADRLGLRAVAVLSRMEGVLGRTAGNAIEMDECIRVLGGRASPGDLLTLVEVLGGVLLALTGRSKGIHEGRSLIREALDAGKGLVKFSQWIGAQGGEGDPQVLLDLLPRAGSHTVIRASADGYVHRISGRQLGSLLGRIGGGRLRVEDRVHPGIGARILIPPGGKVRRGDPVLEILHQEESILTPDVLDSLVRVSPRPPAKRPLVAGLVTSSGFFPDPESASLAV
jgi:pyrimidine-nucleoside phosphorylase